MKQSILVFIFLFITEVSIKSQVIVFNSSWNEGKSAWVSLVLLDYKEPKLYQFTWGANGETYCSYATLTDSVVLPLVYDEDVDISIMNSRKDIANIPNGVTFKDNVGHIIKFQNISESSLEYMKNKWLEFSSKTDVSSGKGLAYLPFQPFGIKPKPINYNLESH